MFFTPWSAPSRGGRTGGGGPAFPPPGGGPPPVPPAAASAGEGAEAATDRGREPHPQPPPTSTNPQEETQQDGHDRKQPVHAQRCGHRHPLRDARRREGGPRSGEVSVPGPERVGQ